MIDYFISNQETALKVYDVRVYRGVTCGSEHHHLKAKIGFRPRSRKKQPEERDQYENMEQTRYKLDSSEHESRRKVYASLDLMRK